MLKLTLLWNFKAQGFSESWYSAGSSLPTTNPDPAILAWCTARAKLCSKAMQFLGYRVTDVDNPRRTILYRNPNPPNTSVQPDVPTNAWLFEAKALNGAGTRQIWVRGVPDSEIEFDIVSQTFALTGGMAADMNGWAPLLTAGPWGIKVVTSLKDATKKASVTGPLSLAPLGGGTRLPGAAAGATVDRPLVVSGFKRPLQALNGTKAYNSSWFIDGADVIITHNAYAVKEMATYVSGASVREALYTVALVQTPQPVGPRERRVGRAFFVPSGRRRR